MKARSIKVTDLGDGVVELNISRPEIRNALAGEVREDLLYALDQAAADVHVAAAVLTGSGGHFSSGGDIRTMGGMSHDKARERMDGVKATVLSVATFPKPLVAAIQGHAVGAGIGLAMLADYIVVDESAVFTFSFRNLALGPDWGLSHTLVDRVGRITARQWLMNGQRVPAVEAVTTGLADEAAEPGELDKRAKEVAAGFAENPLSLTDSIKSQMTDLAALGNALDSETRMQARRFCSDAHNRAVSAFLSQRSRKS